MKTERTHSNRHRERDMWMQAMGGVKAPHTNVSANNGTRSGSKGKHGIVGRMLHLGRGKRGRGDERARKLLSLPLFIQQHGNDAAVNGEGDTMDECQQNIHVNAFYANNGCIQSTQKPNQNKKRQRKNSINFPLLLLQLNSLFTSLSHLRMRPHSTRWKFICECELRTTHKRPEDIFRYSNRRQISIEREREREKKNHALSEWVPTFNGKITPLLWNAVAVRGMPTIQWAPTRNMMNQQSI